MPARAGKGEIMDDWEYSDYDCPKCGELMAYRPCSALFCDDGYCDDSEGDPLNFSEGESYSTCGECRGTGYEEWCRSCGWDNVFKRFLSLKDKAEWEAKQVAAPERSEAK